MAVKQPHVAATTVLAATCLPEHQAELLQQSQQQHRCCLLQHCRLLVNAAEVLSSCLARLAAVCLLHAGESVAELVATAMQHLLFSQRPDYAPCMVGA